MPSLNLDATPHSSLAPMVTPHGLRVCARVRLLLSVVALLGAVLLAGCSSGADTTSTSSEPQSGLHGFAEDSGGAVGSVDSEKGDATKKQSSSGADMQAAAYAANQQLARTGSLSLQVSDATAASARIRAVAAGVSGIVTAEDLVTSTDSGHARTSGTVTISVPASALDATMEKIAGLGTVLDRSVSTEDVTASLVDTDSRIKTMTTSIERLRAFLAQSTKLDQVVSLEKELTTREAELESLKAQLASLKDRVAMSPITVALTTDTSATPPPDDDGFLAGLKSGWAALTASTVAVLTTLGVLLPFLLVLAIVGLPVWGWWRRRTTARQVPTPPTPPAGPPAEPAAGQG
ncbi:MAG: DUF4349 domain-containing protein [Nostocoides sp.]